MLAIGFSLAFQILQKICWMLSTYVLSQIIISTKQFITKTTDRPWLTIWLSKISFCVKSRSQLSNFNVYSSENPSYTILHHQYLEMSSQIPSSSERHPYIDSKHIIYHRNESSHVDSSLKCSKMSSTNNTVKVFFKDAEFFKCMASSEFLMYPQQFEKD